jgi:hypothetical protein
VVDETARVCWVLFLRFGSVRGGKTPRLLGGRRTSALDLWVRGHAGRGPAGPRREQCVEDSTLVP